MSETRFTKGPWEWWTGCSYRRLSSVPSHRDGDVLHGAVLCDGCPDVVVKEADAHLIAAAPDLYEACEEALEESEALNEGWEGLRTEIEDKLRAALAKARGEK